jgi:antitoxin component HigA of HigAB toxin-antitoxin module
MRCSPTAIFLVLLSVAMIQFAVSHLLVSDLEMSTEDPTSQDWKEYRKKAEELEKKIMECEDPVELAKLYLQHGALIETYLKKVGTRQQRDNIND